jgi:ABC-type dipeptide/oligopeptide/nickel transport system permease component
VGKLECVTSFVIRRVLWTIPILWIVVTIVFFMMRSIGGDPFRHGPLLGLSNVGWTKYGDYQPEAIRQNQRERYGLDLPCYEQYANYLRGTVTLDFGPSLSFRDVRVNDIIEELAPRSIELTVLAFLWAGLLGIPIGVLAALRPNSAFDYGARLFSSVGFALPSFFVATLLVYYLSVKLGLFPTSGWTESWKHKVLPSFTLGLVPLAYCVRLVRASMVETLGLDYIRMARAKGLRSSRIVFAHALRNSLVPLVTAIGPLLGYTVTASFIIENIFAVPGVARYYVAAALARDYTVVLGLTVMLAVLIILANLAVDILHRVLDPRLREAPA